MATKHSTEWGVRWREPSGREFEQCGYADEAAARSMVNTAGQPGWSPRAVAAVRRTCSAWVAVDDSNEETKG